MTIVLIDGWEWHQRDQIRLAVASARITPGVTRVPEVMAHLARDSPRQSVFPLERIPPQITLPADETDILIEFPRRTSMALLLRCNAESLIVRQASLWLWSDSVPLDVGLFTQSLIFLTTSGVTLVTLLFLRQMFSTSNEFVAYLYSVIPILATLLLFAIGILTLSRLTTLSGNPAIPYHDETIISATWPPQAEPK